MKIGVADAGGGLRGIYAAGVLDYCLEKNIRFDRCAGVSAGSANMASYLAGQRGRNYRFYRDYSFRKEYMGLGNLFRGGSYVDLEYVYSYLTDSDGEDPLDFDALLANPAELFVVAAEAKTGKVKYFTKADMAKDNYRVLMASCCMPVIGRPVEIDGVPYYDGALGDPVPIKKLFDEGCDRVVLLLSKPAEFPRRVGLDAAVYRALRKKYPEAAKKVLIRAERYNEEVELAKRREKRGEALVLSPKDIRGAGTLRRNKKALDGLYLQGLKDGEKISEWLEKSRGVGQNLKR